MKKLFFFLAALTLSFTAQAAVINGTPNPGEVGRVNWWVNGEGQAQPGDTIVLADGEYLESTITLDKAGLVIMAAEGAKPVISFNDPWAVAKVSATTTFEGITFNGGDSVNYLVAVSGAESGNLTLSHCEFKNWAYWAVSNQFEEGVSVDSVFIDNCLFHDGAQSAISFSKKAPEGKHACNYFQMTNSTLYNIKSTEYAGIIHVSSNNEATGLQNKVIIDHVTMYNLDGADLGIVAIRKSSDLTISNTIIANPAAGERASYVYGGNATNVLYYNVEQDGDLAYTNCTTDKDPLFVDAANADFTLAEGSPAIGAGTDGTNLGDPRWNAVVEVEHTYTVAGSSEAAFGTTWDPTNEANDMVKQEDGTYKWEKEGLELLEGELAFKVTEDHAWTVAYPGSDYKLAIPETGIYTVTITFNPTTQEVAATATKTGDVVIIPTIAMHGNFLGSWADTEEFTKAADEATATLTLTIEKGDYEFGMRIGGAGNWTSNGVAFTRENASAEVVAGSGNLKLTADVAGDYIFTWTYATNILTITFPEKIETAIDNINTAVTAQKVIRNGQLIVIKNGVEFNAQGAKL